MCYFSGHVRPPHPIWKSDFAKSFLAREIWTCCTPLHWMKMKGLITKASAASTSEIAERSFSAHCWDPDAPIHSIATSTSAFRATSKSLFLLKISNLSSVCHDGRESGKGKFRINTGQSEDRRGFSQSGLWDCFSCLAPFSVIFLRMNFQLLSWWERTSEYWEIFKWWKNA